MNPRTRPQTRGPPNGSFEWEGSRVRMCVESRSVSVQFKSRLPVCRVTSGYGYVLDVSETTVRMTVWWDTSWSQPNPDRGLRVLYFRNRF